MLHDTYTDGIRNALTAWRLLGTPETGRNMCTTPDCTAERARLIHQPTQLKRKLGAPTGHCGRCLTDSLQSGAAGLRAAAGLGCGC